MSCVDSFTNATSKVVFVTYLVSFAAHSSNSKINCKIVFDNYLKLRNVFIHDIVTERSHALLTTESPVLSAIYQDIIKNERSVLSLGEGNSDFLLSAIEARKNKGLRTDNMVAVDYAYPKHNLETGRISDLRRASFKVDDGHYVQETTKLVEEYPKNYLHGRFDSLDLKDNEGRRRQFETVYSSYSLNFVLRQLTLEQQVDILERILDHVTPGGTLIIYPFYDLNESAKLAIQGLKTKGTIASSKNQLGNTEIIQKSKN